MREGWLVRVETSDGRPDETVLASADIPETRSEKKRGLLGRDRFDRAMVFQGVRSVHTMGMDTPIDVAHVDRRGRIRRMVTMAPGRIGRWSWRTSWIIEAGPGALERWGVDVGDVVEVRT